MTDTPTPDTQDYWELHTSIRETWYPIIDDTSIKIPCMPLSMSEEIMLIIAEQRVKWERQARIDELSKFWHEANDVYHGIPIDTEAWWYKYHMNRTSEVMRLQLTPPQDGGNL